MMIFMKRDYTKVLWKTEELWKKSYTSQETSVLDISQNYVNRVSKYHDRFHQVETFDFSGSEDTVFTDDYGKYTGLEKSQVLKHENKNVYLFDNHNEMLYPIVEIFNTTKKKYDVVHIDAHPDDAKFQDLKITDLNLNNIKDYITKTRISDFFDAVSEANIIADIHRITHSDNFEFFLPPENPYILSLDIDIFGPEGDFAALEDKVRAIAVAWAKADAVCIAMSPGFINQKYAADIIKIFVNQP